MSPKTSYETNGVHPIIRHDKACVSCELGHNRVRHNKVHEEEKNFVPQVSVGGAGPLDLTEVKLIVVSDYPGYYESKISSGVPMVDASLEKDERRNGMLNSLNAGAFLRMTLRLMYGLDTYSDCWITNAIKCDTNQIKPQDIKHVKPCSKKWLSAELHCLDQYVPNVPILAAGFQAFKGVCHIYDAPEIKNLGANNCRRRKGLMLGQHPLVVTFNPATAARSMPKVITQTMTKKGRLVPTRNEWLMPFLLGSPGDKFLKDLHLLAEHLNVT